MDNAKLIERLIEVQVTLQREKRRYGLKKSYWSKVVTYNEERGKTDMFTESDKTRLEAIRAEYDAIIARIEAVRIAIQLLS